MSKTIGLVGCVKSKRPIAAPAKDLYMRSRLFRGWRAYVEDSCDEWWILSAKHGLVHPQTVLAPYDITLKGQSRGALRTWASHVLQEIRTQISPSDGDVAQIHAGSEYRDFGLTNGLIALGCKIEIPAHHLGIGDQLSFYAASPAGRL